MLRKKTKSGLCKLLLTLIILFIPIGSAHPLVDYKIHIEGISQTPLINTLKVQLQQTLQTLPRAPSRNTMKRWLHDSVLNIRETLAACGYFNPIIRPVLNQNKDYHWKLNYQIFPGPLLKITALEISVQGEGCGNIELKKVITRLPIHKGETFISKNYEQAKKKLLLCAIEQGYLSAALSKHIVLINRKLYISHIILTLDTGPRYYFGPITFEQSILKDSLLRRYLLFQQGDPYSSSELLTLQDRLKQSGYFKSVSINNNLVNNKKYIPVSVNLLPKSSQHYTAGIGYSTDIGLRGTLGWESRYLNKAGHRFNAICRFSKLQNSLQANYIIPGKHPITDNYSLNIAYIQKKLPQVDSSMQQIGMANNDQWKNWRRNVFLNYQIEHFNYLNRPTTHARLLTPGINLSRSQFDNPLFALHGYRINLRLQGAHEDLFSNASFLQAQLQGNYIISWNSDSRLILRGDIGYTLTSNLTHFPPSLLFYAGGSQSIRGYGYQSLGPGRYLLTASTEYQHRLVKQLYGAFFFDMGNAVNHLPMTLQKGVGLGLVWASPLGPIEITLGKALSLPKQPLRIQFSVGFAL